MPEIHERKRQRQGWRRFPLFQAQNGEGQEKDSVIRVALAGNPNSGKTSLFNYLTGQNQHVGNYSGVTVEKKIGYRHHGKYRIEFVDLPGTYSLTAYSPEEIVTREYVLKDRPDLIVDVLDSTNLERNLYLCLQFQELGLPVIGALNMSDEAELKGVAIDEKLLGDILDVPMVKTVGRSGRGIGSLLDLIVDIHEGKRTLLGRSINYGREIEGEIEKLLPILSSDRDFAEKFPVRWIAIKLLEEDKHAIEKVDKEHQDAFIVQDRAAQSRQWLYKHYKDESVQVVGEQRYAYIHGAAREAVKRTKPAHVDSLTNKLDRIVLNRYFGFVLFFAVMFGIYQFTFLLGNPLGEWIGIGFGRLGEFLTSTMPATALRDLLVDGIIGGVGGVIEFLPLVVLLFLSLSFLEDSGYMARAAFVMDKFFHLFGMHGRSFIPFMIATGCAVPAVMSARTLVNPRDRIITVLVTPIMMCGAKVPVVAMLASAFFEEKAGTVFWLVWLAGWLLSFTVAWVFRKTLFRGEVSPFVMELPPYRMPTPRAILMHMWDRSYMYIRKAGTIILGLSIVIWFLLYYPKPPNYAEDLDMNRQQVFNEWKMTASVPPTEAELEALDSRVAALENEFARDAIEHSFLGRLGIAMEPIFRPAGFDWRISIGLLGGLTAKEVIISTLGIVHGLGDNEDEGVSVTLQREFSSNPDYSPAMALAMMFFVLIYVPCLATLAVVKKELGSWKWPIFLASYTFVFAWGMAVLIYQVGSRAGL